VCLCALPLVRIYLSQCIPLIFDHSTQVWVMDLQHVRAKLELQPIDATDTAAAMAELDRRMNQISNAVSVRLSFLLSTLSVAVSL